jgi:type VI secretion system protein ImpM
MALWRRRNPQPPSVTCYGKLPATGDFIRLNATGAENAGFDRWLQGSINLARQTMGDSFQQAYQGSVGLFVYRGDDGDGSTEPERGMVGVWAASADSAGRLYPMMVATSYDYEHMLGVGAALPIAVWPFLQAAYDLVANGRDLGVDSFLARVGQLQLVSLASPELAQAPYLSWVQQNSMRSLWESAFGTAQARHGIVQLVHDSVAYFRGNERPQTSLAVRFPIAAGDGYAAAVWTDMTLRLAKWQRTVLNAFWTPRHDLMLHLGPPHVATFRELIAGTGQTEHLTDLLAPFALDEAAARAKLGPQIAAAVDNSDATIHAFLAAL